MEGVGARLRNKDWSSAYLCAYSALANLERTRRMCIATWITITAEHKQRCTIDFTNVLMMPKGPNIDLLQLTTDSLEKDLHGYNAIKKQ